MGNMKQDDLVVDGVQRYVIMRTRDTNIDPIKNSDRYISWPELLTEEEILEEIAKSKDTIRSIPKPTPKMLKLHRLLWKL